MKLYRAAFILLFLFASCSGGGSGNSGGPPGGNPPPGNGDNFFVATYVQGNNSIDYNPVSVTTQIGFTEVLILTFNIQGETFNMSFLRPEQVPAEINLGLSPVDPTGGAIITLGASSYVYSSGTLIVTEMTNDRVSGEFDFFAVSQLDDSVIQVIGSFSLPDGILAFQ